MSFKAKAIGRDALLRKLQEVAPEAEKRLAEAKLAAAKEAASEIAARAPVRKTGNGGTYKASIQGARQADNPDILSFGHKQSQDPDAVGVYASFIWRFLEFGTKASPGWGPRRDRRYKKRTVMTVGRGAHWATPAMPHIFDTWRNVKPKIKRKMNKALYDAAREIMRGK